MKKSIVILLLLVVISMIMVSILINRKQQDIEIVDEQTATAGLYHREQEQEQYLISMITKLEENIATICELSIDDKQDIRMINSNLFALLVRNRYGINSKQFMSIYWNSILSELDSEIIGILSAGNEIEEDVINSSFLLLTETIDKYVQSEIEFYHEEIDFVHMMAVLDLNYNDLSMSKEAERYIDYLAGWGGDLLTYFGEALLLIDENKLTEEVEVREFLVEGFKKDKSITFSKSDFYADIDGVNLACLMNEGDLLLSEALENYGKYSRDEKYDLFLEHMMGIENYENEVRILYAHLSQVDGKKTGENQINGLRTYMRILAKNNLHREPYAYEVEALIDAWIMLWKEFETK